MFSLDQYTRFAIIYDQTVGHNGGLLARHIINPVIFSMLGDVQGCFILDVCCGQGYLARELAQQGAEVVGLDISAGLLAVARHQDVTPGLITRYVLADVIQPLPLTRRFHAAVCTLSLMDIREYDRAIRNVGTVLLPHGRFILSLMHPLHFHNKDYFDKETPRLHADLARQGMSLYYWHRPLEDYVRSLSTTGFCIRQMREPRPGLEAIVRYPDELAGRDEQPSFIVIEAVRH